MLNRHLWTLKRKDSIEIRSQSPVLTHFFPSEFEKTAKSRFSPEHAMFSYWERRPIESTVCATASYFMGNPSHVVDELFKPCLCIIQSKGLMHATRYDYSTRKFPLERLSDFLPTTFFSDLYHRFHIAGLLRKTKFRKSGRIFMNPP